MSLDPAQTAVRPTRSVPVGLLLALSVAALGVHHDPSMAVASPPPAPRAAPPLAPRLSGGPHGGRPDVAGTTDGVVPDGVTVFDDGYPAVARLDPGLLGALRQAATAAADEGIMVFVNSGWRSRTYQNRLLREAVSKYGSEAEAARWVATADTSPHVSGNAVDIGPTQATAWLSRHGARYGLCQIYRNEPWHYELRREAIGHGCPPLYADPTHDPRMQ